MGTKLLRPTADPTNNKQSLDEVTLSTQISLIIKIENYVINLLKPKAEVDGADTRLIIVLLYIV